MEENVIRDAVTEAAEEVLSEEKYSRQAEVVVQSDSGVFQALRSLPDDVGMDIRREVARRASEKIIENDDPIEQLNERLAFEDYIFDELSEPTESGPFGCERPVGFDDDAVEREEDNRRA